MYKAIRAVALCGSIGVLLGACSKSEAPVSAETASADAAFQKKLQEQLLDAKPGSVVEIPAGTYRLTSGLTLRGNGVTIRGAGMDKTILSFKGQITGPEGMLVYASNFTIEGLTIEDSKGDGLKINDGDNITIRKVKVQWTGGSKVSNGAYGIYPVKTRNVLIEDCVAIAASDAGIYVGQSNGVVVRRSRAEQNVAGIEIENTINADVYDNVATNNTGGILVFNMPNLSQPGHSTRVYKNKVEKNNLGNFAARGTAVASVPAGSGIVINSNSKVEIFDNDVTDNQTANVIISSYHSTGYYTEKGVAAGYDPYPKAIYVYGNRFKGGGDSPDGLDLKALKIAMYGLSGHLPDVLWDGYVDTKLMVKGVLPADQRICIQDGVDVLNADGPNKYKNPSKDTAPYRCELAKLPPVTITQLAAQS
ncbi:parallel beta-helix domain-containing protein [Duganella sp. LjRoot269]|jgi:parallel beta-helix repeat protein|uniref:parallel beta-helix domain-containing protein n=1 Tax=Duganella sp. LjRoot269 TaxID=3342305 RepID=UPI003ED0FD2B